jgi:hypothetical protein
MGFIVRNLNPYMVVLQMFDITATTKERFPLSILKTEAYTEELTDIIIDLLNKIDEIELTSKQMS